MLPAAFCKQSSSPFFCNKEPHTKKKTKRVCSECAENQVRENEQQKCDHEYERSRGKREIENVKKSTFNYGYNSKSTN